MMNNLSIDDKHDVKNIQKKDKYTFSRRKFQPLSNDRKEMLLKSNDGVIPTPPSRERSDSGLSSILGNSNESCVGDITALKKLQKQEWNELPWDLFIDEDLSAQQGKQSFFDDNLHNSEVAKTVGRSSSLSNPTKESCYLSSSHNINSYQGSSNQNLLQKRLKYREVSKSFLTIPTKLERKYSIERLKYKGLGSRRTRKHTSINSSDLLLKTLSSNAIDCKEPLIYLTSQTAAKTPDGRNDRAIPSGSISGFHTSISRSISNSDCLLDNGKSNVNCSFSSLIRSQTPRPSLEFYEHRRRSIRQSSASSIQSMASSISLKSVNSAVYQSQVQRSSTSSSPPSSFYSLKNPPKQCHMNQLSNNDLSKPR